MDGTRFDSGTMRSLMPRTTPNEAEVRSHSASIIHKD